MTAEKGMQWAVPDDVADLALSVGVEDPGTWWHNCHAASLSIVRSGLYPGARVARGICEGVGGQHSWVVLGDPYGWQAEIIDPTLWSYVPSVQRVWRGERRSGLHTPHGAGYFFQGEAPYHHGGETIHLAPAAISQYALEWLAMAGAPWDLAGWSQLCHLPVEGWPSREILGLLYQDPRFRPLIPIDIAGMVTDHNPGGLYLPEVA